MKRWSVIVELPAQQDIAKAHLWLAEREPDAADRWFDSIFMTFAWYGHLKFKSVPLWVVVLASWGID